VVAVSFQVAIGEKVRGCGGEDVGFEEVAFVGGEGVVEVFRRVKFWHK